MQCIQHNKQLRLDFSIGTVGSGVKTANAEPDVLERVRDIWFASGSSSNAERTQFTQNERKRYEIAEFNAQAPPHTDRGSMPESE